MWGGGSRFASQYGVVFTDIPVFMTLAAFLFVSYNNMCAPPCQLLTRPAFPSVSFHNMHGGGTPPLFAHSAGLPAICAPSPGPTPSPPMSGCPSGMLPIEPHPWPALAGIYSLTIFIH